MTSNLNQYGNWYDTELAKGIIKRKYLHEGESTFAEFAERVSSIINEGDREDIKKAMYDGDFFLAGRALYGAGSKGKFKASMSNCFTAGHKVITQNGLVNIEDIKIGDMVIASDGKLHKVINTMSRKYNGDLIELKGNNLYADIHCTPNHKFLTTDGWVRADRIIASDNPKAKCYHKLKIPHIGIEYHELRGIAKMTSDVTVTSSNVLENQECELYNIQVEGDPTYTVNGVICHNCYIEPSPNDSIESIFDTCKEMGRIFSYGGGVGINISNLRPKGAKVNNSARTSTGAVSFMDIFNQVGEIIGSNGRRAAIIIGLNCSHPDIEEFLDIKQNNDKIQSANISILFTDAFMRCVEENDNFTLRFDVPETGEKIRKKINARAFFKKFASKCNDWAEPGALFIDTINSFSLLSGYPKDQYRVEISNPCVSGDTQILTDKGYLPIETLIGKKVNIWNGYRWSEVEPKITGYNQKMLRITFSNGCDIKCTRYHKFVMCDGSRMQAEELRVGLTLASWDNPDWDKVQIGSMLDSPYYYLGFACKNIKVVKIEEIDDAATVYCVNEPFNHTVTFNGIMTGNCAEYTGCSYNSCNLGSINLYNCIKNPFTDNAELDVEKFTNLVKLGVRALNDVLDYGYDMQPLPANRKCIDDWRPIGLGLFGVGDALIAMKLKYGSKKSIDFIKQVGKNMINTALFESIFLAEKYGKFRNFNDYVAMSFLLNQPFIDSRVHYLIEVHGLRNGSLLSIAPTGTIGTMCGCTGGIEPIYQVSYERTTHSMEKTGKTFKVYAKAVEHLLIHNGLDPEKISISEIKDRFPWVVDAYDINPNDRIDFQAALQSYIDNAISSTVNLKEDTTSEEVFNLYLRAWRAGCKGITVFRDNCKRISILGKDRKHDSKPEEVKTPVDHLIGTKQLDCHTPQKRNGIKELSGKTFVFKTACVRKLYVTVNKNYNDDIFEVFVGADTGCQANINTITRLTSYALRLGGKVDDIIDELNSAVCPACSHLIRSGDKDCKKSCASCIAEALDSMYHGIKEEPKPIIHTIDQEPEEETHNDMGICPECGEKTLKPEGKCVNCTNCGYSKCD